MTENNLPCPACGGPNQPEAGKARMTCGYCGANIVIPEKFRVKVVPEAVREKQTFSTPEADPSEFLRKVQPVAIKAWNAYAYWTWIRYFLPGCLIVSLVLFLICLAVGALPFLLGLFNN